MGTGPIGRKTYREPTILDVEIKATGRLNPHELAWNHTPDSSVGSLPADGPRPAPAWWPQTRKAWRPLRSLWPLWLRAQACHGRVANSCPLASRDQYVGPEFHSAFTVQEARVSAHALSGPCFPHLLGLQIHRHLSVLAHRASDCSPSGLLSLTDVSSFPRPADKKTSFAEMWGQRVQTGEQQVLRTPRSPVRLQGCERGAGW